MLEYLISRFPEFLTDAVKDNNGFTALHHATINRHEQCIKLLLSQGFIRDDITFSPLQWSLTNSDVKCSNIYFDELLYSDIESMFNFDNLNVLEKYLARSLYDNKFCDVTFYFENNYKIKAHKIICSSQVYFQKLFNRKDNISSIFMSRQDFKYSVDCFQAYLNFIYSGSCGSITTETRIELLSFAKDVDLKNLLKAAKSQNKKRKKGIKKYSTIKVNKRVESEPYIWKPEKKPQKVGTVRNPRKRTNSSLSNIKGVNVAVGRKERSRSLHPDDESRQPSSPPENASPTRTRRIRRNIEQSELTCHFSEFVGSVQYYDVTFILKGKRIFGHKIILCNRSPYLKKLIKDSRRMYKEKNIRGTLEINLGDVTYNVIYVIFRYLYTNGVGDILSQLETNEIAKLAEYIKKFELENMDIKIELSLIQRITIRNVINIFFIAIECGWDFLKELCSDYINLYYPVISLTDEYKAIDKDKLSLLREIKREKENSERNYIYYYQKFSTVI